MIISKYFFIYPINLKLTEYSKKVYNVQIMNKKTNDYEHLSILRKIHSDQNTNQRKMANDLGLSLGKLNFCLNELRKKGYVKYKNFKKNENKINYIYILTPAGISKKTKLLINFMKRKMNEYDELKKDFDKTVSKHNDQNDKQI